ncbi:uncharacterized protein LOC125683129 [Ostrea edulis]|uniref:uncharacterized protein LOC125683129 n=1 Tax=Ostrea edulis TaxID=37623 RepID=UPI002095E05D|nr:uncharacterized protein LOC125683129 [Ostrea edulis]XP_055996348.1 uncharacterized protein LOC125683129 [Ostrea edulis]
MDDKQSTVFQLFKISHLAQNINGRPLPGNSNTFLDYYATFSDKFLYIGSMKLEVDQRFYTTPFLHLPFDILCKLLHVGKSSFSEIFDFTNRVSTHCFAQVSKQQIMVDPNTRQSMEIPLSWRDKYGKMSTGSPLIMKRLTRPATCILNVTHKIQASDIDSQGHTNFLSYIKLCIDVSKRVAVDGCYHRFSTRSLENGLKEFQIRYQNEVLLGEEVAVHVWEAADRTDQLCFEITKGPDVCIQATMAFFQTAINMPKFHLLDSKI